MDQSKALGLRELVVVDDTRLISRGHGDADRLEQRHVGEEQAASFLLTGDVIWSLGQNELLLVESEAALDTERYDGLDVKDSGIAEEKPASLQRRITLKSTQHSNKY